MRQLYAGPIIDPHHHLWDLDMGCHPWLEADESQVGDIAPLRRNYLPADYRRDAANQRVVATVHIEASWRPDDSLAETRWLDTLDKSGGIAICRVVHVPLGNADAPALLAQHCALGNVVGVRDILSWHPNPALRFADRPDKMDDPAWRAGLRALAQHRLNFDLMLYPHQVPDAVRLVRDFPEQPFILNHCGSPIERDTEGMARWRQGLAALAQAPNVAIKISDLVAYDPEWTLESLRQVILACIEAFGTGRAMFASDFPVTGLHATFDETYDAFRTVVAEFSADEQRALFFGNAKRLYHMPVWS
ncbi:MAG: amidohydrolase family protein [Alphaproteobacteria bacterium]